MYQMLWCMVALGLALPVYAQTASDVLEAQRQAVELQRQQQLQMRRDIDAALPPARAPSGADLRNLAPKVDASVVGSGCRAIREIVISGATLLPVAFRDHITATFAGRCLGSIEIAHILGDITQHYIERGFITTRIYLPEQDLSQGTLKILVVEGSIGKISLVDGARDSVGMNAFPAKAGEIFNLRDVEQAIEQINKLSSNNARMSIEPGERPGESTIEIQNSPGTPLHASFSTDNQGAENTGRTQIGATVIADRLLGFNELWVLTHRESQPNDPNRQYAGSNSLSLAMPFGYYTASLAWSRSDYVSTIHAPSGLELKSNGDSATDSVGLDRVMYRDQTTRWSVASLLSMNTSRNYLAGQFLSVSSRSLTSLALDSTVTTPVLGGSGTLGFGYSEGLDYANALKDPENLPDSAPRAQYKKFRYSYNYVLPFQIGTSDYSFSSAYTAQRGLTALYGSEQIGIGGITSVRGFVRNTLAGEYGWYVRNEISTRRAVSWGENTVSVRVFAGLDIGSVSNRAAGVPEGRLTGMAVGFSTDFKGGSLEIFTSRPLSAPDYFNLEAPQTWLRLSYAI